MLFLVLISCGNIKPEGTEVKTQDVKIEDFTELELEGDFKVMYVEGVSNNLRVETYPNIYENLKIEKRGKKLIVKEKRKTEGVEIYNIILFSSGKISKIKMSDSVIFSISSQIMSDDFSLEMEDNAKFVGSVLSNKAKIKLSNNANLRLYGKTLDADVSLENLAEMRSPYWFVNNLNINAKDGAFVEVVVEEKLEGKIENNAKLIYVSREKPSKNIIEKDKAEVKRKIIN